MMFRQGGLWRSNEWGYLPRIARIASVSGGSIIAAALGARWKRLAIDATTGIAERFETELAAPICELAGRTIDKPAVLKGLALPGSISHRLAKAYGKHLFGDQTL